MFGFVQFLVCSSVHLLPLIALKFCSTVWGVWAREIKDRLSGFNIKVGGFSSSCCFLIAACHQSTFEGERHSFFCYTVGAVGAMGGILFFHNAGLFYIFCFVGTRLGRWSGGWVCSLHGSQVIGMIAALA